MPGLIGEEFIKRTCYEYLKESDQFKGIPQPPLELKGDPSRERVYLPPPGDLNTDGIDLRRAIEGRISLRSFRDIPVSIEELSLLLWFTQGVREKHPEATLRNVPSAGARHPLETYLVINNTDGLSPGLYRFLAIEHELEIVDLSSRIRNDIYIACLKQAFVKKCAVHFIWVAHIYRSVWRYDERAYRYVFLDAGHTCQNLYLASSLVGCGTCGVAAFHDQSVCDLLGIDGRNLFPVYMASVGKK